MNPWVQSLRADSSRTPRSTSSTAEPNSLRRLTTASSKSSQPPVKEPHPPKVRQVVVGNPSIRSKKGAGANSLPEKRSGTVVGAPTKCSNLCCNHLSGNLAHFVKSHSKTKMKLRINYRVEPAEATRIQDQISRIEPQYASLKKEILRLKSILAACPPPERKSLFVSEREIVSNLCMHACCNSGVLPPRASTEWHRLQHIIRQLQLKSREISQYLNTRRSLLAPIRRLPPELFGIVFSFVVIPDPYDPSTEPASRTAGSAVRLAHVCSYWRTIVLNTSRLWATIVLHPYRPRIEHLQFYAAHAKASPLTVRCPSYIPRPLFEELTRMSHKWQDIALKDYFSTKLDVIRLNIPLLRSLSLRTSYRHLGQKCSAFQFAPSLRRVMLNAEYWEYTWPFSFILPWKQVTSLTLSRISPSLFSDCLRGCPQLLYFSAIIYIQFGGVQQTMELQNSLRKLVLRGPESQQVVVAHSFPHLLSLSIETEKNVLHSVFFAFLARSSRLEMLSVSGCSSAATDLASLLLATPSLRILHFRDSHTATVTPKFHTPLVTPAANDPFHPVRLPSRAELNVEECTALDDVTLLALIQARMNRDPLFDPDGIEQARLQIENVPFDPEAELDYLNILDLPLATQD